MEIAVFNVCWSVCFAILVLDSLRLFRRALVLICWLLFAFRKTFLAKQGDTVVFRLHPSIFFYWVDLLVLPNNSLYGRIWHSELLQNSFAAFPLLVSTHNAQPKVLTKCFCLLRHAEKDLEWFFIIAPSVYWIGHIFYAFRLCFYACPKKAPIWELLRNNIKAYYTI